MQIISIVKRLVILIDHIAILTYACNVIVPLHECLAPFTPSSGMPVMIHCITVMIPIVSALNAWHNQFKRDYHPFNYAEEQIYTHKSTAQ